MTASRGCGQRQGARRPARIPVSLLRRCSSRLNRRPPATESRRGFLAEIKASPTPSTKLTVTSTPSNCRDSTSRALSSLPPALSSPAPSGHWERSLASSEWHPWSLRRRRTATSPTGSVETFSAPPSSGEFELSERRGLQATVELTY